METLRDRRVRTSAFIMPTILLFMMLYLFGSVFGAIGKKQGQVIHVVRSDSPFVKALRKSEFKIETVPTLAKGKQLILSGAAKVVVDVLPTNAKTGQTPIEIYSDPTNEGAGVTKGILTGAVDEINHQVEQEVLKAHNVPAAAAEPFKIEDKPIQVGEGPKAGEMIVGLLPYLIVIWAFYGGMSVASDLVAGEKDKNTLETLLISPIGRTQIVMGKFFALATVCFISSASSLVGLLAYAVIKPPGSAELLKQGLGITPVSLATILMVLLPTVALFASILLALSSYAKNPREAQAHASVASIVVLMPAIFSQFIGFTSLANASWLSYVPILNSATNIRAALLGRADFVGALTTMVVGVVIAIVGLRIAIWLFNREQVLTRV